MNQLEKAQAEYAQFPAEFASIIISTVNSQGIPNASYAPFVRDDSQNIYIYVSGLATHTQNLHIHPYVSVLFIEDETKTKQIFSRRRLTFDCLATLIERETSEWGIITQEFQERFGNIIEILSSLPDFRVFQLTPTGGKFVTGFGEAYNISGDNLNQIIPITKDKLG
jgi:putative heme iron utilization protein